MQLRVQTIKIEFRLTGVPIRFAKFAPLRKLHSSEAGQPPIYYIFERESVSKVTINTLTSPRPNHGSLNMNTLFENRKALIVDDEPHIRELLERILRPEGFDCSTAATGEEALELLGECSFDLIISDIMMPGMSGIDLLNVVMKYHPGAAVILVTAVDDMDTGVMALRMGACSYIIKPFTRNQVLLDVASALQRTNEKGLGREAPAKDPEDGPSENEPAGFEGIEHPTSGESLQDGMDEDITLRGDDSPTQDLQGLKRTISAMDAIKCVRSGMDDLTLMKRYNISKKGLANLFKRLIDQDYLKPEHFYGASPSCHEIILDEEIPSRFLALAASVYEVRNPENRGFLTHIDDKGLNVSGIEAKQGDSLTLKINPGGVIESDEIWMDASCVAHEPMGPENRPLSCFQIRNISTESLENFRRLIHALSFSFG
jgi:DNA-binding response OmpR family regulator